MTVKNRIEWIDFAKGMIIILVAYGHMGISEIPLLAKYVSSFRMPFFFIISGLLFSADKYPTLLLFLKKRLHTLVIPFFICSFIVLTIYALLGSNEFFEQLRSVISNGWGGYALWFIPVLFAAEIGYYLIRKKIAKNIWVFVSLIIVAICGYLLFLANVNNPYNWSFVPTAMFYYGLGNLCRANILKLDNRLSNTLVILSISLFLSLSVFLTNSHTDYFVNYLGDGFCYVSAISGSIMMVCLSIITVRILPQTVKKSIVFFGKNSFAVLAFHQVLINTIVALTPFRGSLARVTMWLSLTLIILFINKYTPFIFGKK